MKKFEYVIDALHNLRANLKIANKYPTVYKKEDRQFFIKSNKKDIKEITAAIKFLKSK